MTSPAPAPRSTSGGAAVAMVLGAATSVQVGATAASALFPLVGAPGAAALRLLLAALVMAVAVRPRVRRWTRRQLVLSTAFGAVLAAMNTSFYAALERVPLGVAVTCEFLGPLTLAAVLTRRRRDLLWVLLALAGVLALGLGGDGAGGRLDPVGVLLALLAGACWAGYVLLSARVGAAVPGQGGLAVASVVAGALVLPLGAVTAGADLLHPHALALGLAAALMSSVLPYSLELVALRRLPERTFGVLLSLEPAIAALVGWLLLSQALPVSSVLAIAVVVVASAGATASAARSAPDAVGADRADATHLQPPDG